MLAGPKGKAWIENDIVLPFFELSLDPAGPNQKSTADSDGMKMFFPRFSPILLPDGRGGNGAGADIEAALLQILQAQPAIPALLAFQSDFFSR